MTAINPYIKNAINIYECLFWIRTWRSTAVADVSTAIHIIILIERYVGIVIKKSILKNGSKMFIHCYLMLKLKFLFCHTKFKEFIDTRERLQY